MAAFFLRIIRKCFLFSFLFLTACASDRDLAAGQNQVCFQEQCLNVELAQTKGELTKGLQFRENMDRNAGMLFIFPQNDTYDFWMKDTLMPLDIIWISEDKKVIYISENTPPCRQEQCPVYGPGQELSRYVLEVNAGAANRLGIKIGDEAHFILE